MSLPKIDEIISLTDSELEDEILNVKKELFRLRVRLRVGAGDKESSFKPHQITHSKHRLSQLLMIKKNAK